MTNALAYHVSELIIVVNRGFSHLLKILNPVALTLLLQFQEKCELGCLRAIVLFNPDARGLDSNVSSQVAHLQRQLNLD